MKHLHQLFRLSLLAGTMSFLAGCTVGPKYVRPNYPSPPAFRGADNAPVASDTKESLGDEQWAAVYREPELQELIRKALVNNYDVRIAAQRILEQQAQVKITRSQEFPSFTVGGNGIGATLPSSLGSADSQPAGGRIVQCFRMRGHLISGVCIAGRLRRPAHSCWRRSGRSERFV